MSRSESSATPWKVDQASLWITGGAFFLALMSALSHEVGSRCDWSLIALVRAVVMFVTSALLVKLSGRQLVFLRPRTLWIRSLAGSFSLVCNFYALTRMPVADAITLMNVHPLWISLITALLHRRWPRSTEFLGVLCGLAGVALIERPHLAHDGAPALVALLSSLSSAVAMLGLHQLKSVDSRAVVAHFAGVASVVSLFVVGVKFSQGLILMPQYPLSASYWLLAVGATGTVGQIMLTRAYALGSPTRVAVVGLTQVMFARIFDVLIWGRELGPLTLAGFAMVLAPSTWLSLRSVRLRTNPPSST